jgi:uncharacterized iron-regulated membrane protein
VTDPGPELARFEASPSDQRALAHLRTACAILAALGAITMMLGTMSVPVLMIALLGLLISVAWLAQARRLRRSAAAPEPGSLTVYGAGYALREHDRNDWVAWSDVEKIEVDEERLDIVVTKRDACRVRIEPRYAGVDLYELVHTLDNARASAQSAGEHVDSEQDGPPGWRASGEAR